MPMIENKHVRIAAQLTAGAGVVVGTTALIRSGGSLPQRVASASVAAVTTATLPLAVAAGAVANVLTSDFLLAGASAYARGARQFEPIGVAIGSVLGVTGQHLFGFATSLAGGTISALLTAGGHLAGAALQGASAAVFTAGEVLVRTVNGGR